MQVTAWLRDASWLNRSRIRLYGAVLFLFLAVSMASVASLQHDLIGAGGIPFGSDFTSFRAAAGLAAAGRPEAVYEAGPLHAAERGLFGGREVRYFYFFYPPVFLLFCLPLALLPYGPALFAWLALTGLGFLRVLRGFLPKFDETLFVLAMPMLFINTAFGQNGFLSAFLMGGGALCLPGRPVMAGIFWGMLVYKPHLSVLVPVLLVAGGAWRALAAAAATALALLALSWVAFGAPAWHGFFASSGMAREVLEANLVGGFKMQSVFAGARILGSSLVPAYVAQGAAALIAIAVLIRIARLPLAPVHGAVLAGCALLTTPFLLTYDLAVLYIPMAWLAGEGLRTGFRPWEKVTLLLAYMTPLLAEGTTWAEVAIPWAPVATALLLAAILRRVEENPAAHAV